jgi:methanol metabolism-related c-type cytochrome
MFNGGSKVKKTTVKSRGRQGDASFSILDQVSGLKISLAGFALAAGFVLAVAGPVRADAPKPASDKDGKYFDANGDPTFRMDADGKVDWFTYSGFLRYHSECHVCHGPDGMGSTYAPALADSMKTMDYATFLATVAQGKQDLQAGQEKVMPTFGLNKNVMCYVDDIFIYLKARAVGDLPRARPTSHDPKPQSAKDAQDACMGPE